MRKFKGYVRTNKVGSSYHFEFEVDDEATEQDIEKEARESMFENIEWNYEEDLK